MGSKAQTVQAGTLSRQQQRSGGQLATENLGDTDIFIDKHTLLIKVIDLQQIV